METYQQIHDFTPSGAVRFAEFIARHAKSGVGLFPDFQAERKELGPEMLKLECLGVIEDNLNSVAGGPLAWELSPVSSIDGMAHTFTAEPEDLIIEHVTPDE